ncbi:MAG TPA: TAXI family TRAP transporter solute-binding subunit [Thermosynechococcaceae cyanobacterium]
MAPKPTSQIRSVRSRSPRAIDPAAKLVVVGLAGFSLGLVVILGWNFISSTLKTHKLVLAAGSRDGESYILSQAVKQVVEARNPKIQIEVVETGGTQENITRLEKGEVQLITAQADVPTGPMARTVAILYQDGFQLIVKDKSRINQFSDLKGARVALPQKGGQFRSFLEVASHYGLQQKDFKFVGAAQEDANTAFQKDQADALFRVRALGNKTVLEMVQQHQGRLVAIDQAAALKIKYPAFEPATIPKGAYRGGEPPVPAADLATIAVQRTLLASRNLDNEIVREITAVLDGQRQDIANRIPDNFSDVRPLVASIKKPETTGGTGIPIHPGALAHFDRDQPSFIQENADYIALILTVILLLGSWTWEFKSWINRRRKDVADVYIEEAITLMTRVQDDQQEPDQALEELDRCFARAATALVEEKISQESFRTLSEAYKAVRDVVEHKQRQAERRPSRLPKPAAKVLSSEGDR